MVGSSTDCRSWLRGAKQGVAELDRVPGEVEVATSVDPTICVYKYIQIYEYIYIQIYVNIYIYTNICKYIYIYM